MKISSPVFESGKRIPEKYTCQGININPPLEFFDVPKEAQSLALIFDDPDVPEHIRKERMYVHWVVYDIDPKTKKIEEGTKKLGTFGVNTGGSNDYKGPCPPDREHRYFFKLYALDKKLGWSAGKTKEDLLQAMEGHILAQAELMGRYEQFSKK